MSRDNTLAKTIGLATAVGLAITMVVGSGLLILPGLAYREAGSAAVYAWGISALISIPLLVVFARLGAEIPGAGGVAGFMQAAFSRRAGAATEILILGTIPGGAAIAITGGKYFSSLFDAGSGTVMLGTLVILLIGGTANYFGARVSGRVQQLLALVLVTLLALIALLTLALGDTTAGEGFAAGPRALDALPTVALVFFAFVGWELMSFTTEEFKNPQRDFPLMVAISFIIVVVLYLLVAATIQLVLPRNHPQMANAPIAAMLTAVMGRGSGQFVSIMGILMVVANFISVVWAFSRLSFSSAREGLLPGTLARIHPEAQIPRNAVVASTGAFGAVAAFYFMGIVSQSLLFELAGINFFMSYMLAVLAYIKRVPTVASKIFGTATLACVGFVFIGFGVKTIYPLALFVSGLLLYSVRANRSGVGGQP